MAAIVQGRPRPRKTFTELEPVMLVIDASAVGSLIAAALEANVSGSEVPDTRKARKPGRPWQRRAMKTCVYLNVYLPKASSCCAQRAALRNSALSRLSVRSALMQSDGRRRLHAMHRGAK
eukprot:5255391-Pleurochrysis_carterae.AAC.1